MDITLNVDGMMCQHCEARVKSTLESTDGVLCALPSHEKKQVVIKLSKSVDVNVLKRAIEEQGYKVID